MVKQERVTTKPGVSGNGKPANAIGNETVQEALPAESFAGHDETARLAYIYWEARGCPDGSAEEDWFHAEQELRHETGPIGTPNDVVEQGNTLSVAATTCA
jgi:hypothetical protein